MSLYSAFKTDKELEVQGVAIDYGDFKIVLARAGGANHKFAKVANAKVKPYRRMMEAGTLPPEIDRKLTAEIYSEAVVIGWWTKVSGEFTSGIESPEGEILPFSQENVCNTLLALPDLMTEVIQQAQDLALFKAEEREEDLGNS